MSIVYSTNVVNARLQVVVDAIDAGAGSGLLIIGTASLAVVLATITLSKPSGSITNRVLTFSIPSTTTAVATGTPVTANITDSTGTVVISGLTVGIAGTDLIVSQSNIATGDIVSLLSGTITGT